MGLVVSRGNRDVLEIGRCHMWPIPGETSPPDPARLTDLFHREHDRVYAFKDNDAIVEVTTVRLQVRGRMPPVTLPPVARQPRRSGLGGRIAPVESGMLAPDEV